MKDSNIGIQVSRKFKEQASKAIASIILFLITYVLMLVMAIGLTFLCVYGGVMLIAFKPMLLTIALGIGLGSLGILVLFFLLKFIFKTNKTDLSHLKEIQESDEPELFSLIKEIVNKVGTTFPKKVYLSSEVNASVFYSSSFWSMFLPTKKNLTIGLGLVNSISKSELTAILSHEFGHFSQKTMKVGSYVYHVNQIIFNLLYDNDSYDSLIQKWANINGYFSIFVIIAVKILNAIKWVLRKMYGLVNISYMGLSREMEFHADEIAASVTGIDPLKSSLLRMSIADHSFSSVLSFYDKKLVENLWPENIFSDHLYALNFIASESGVAIKNDLPQVSEQELNRFKKSKLVIKDQWASHPSTEERIRRLEKIGISIQSSDNSSANSLFSDLAKTQKELTDKMFAEVSYQGEISKMRNEIFQVEFVKNFLEITFPKFYNGYYDDKNPLFFEINEKEELEVENQIEDLFADEKIDMVYTSIALQNDIEVIKQISNKTLKMSTFDYDGKKYSLKESKDLLMKLELEFHELNEEIRNNDIQIFQYFRNLENSEDNNSILENLYSQLFNYDRDYDSKFEIYTRLSNDLEFINYITPHEQIRANLLDVEMSERKLKTRIKELLEDSFLRVETTKEMKDNFELYLSKDWRYFGNEKYFDQNLEILFTAMNNYAYLLSRGYFLLKKNLLDYQVRLINASQK